VLSQHGVPIAPSSYRAFRRRPPSARAARDSRVSTEIRRVHGHESYGRGVYGVRKVHAQLAREGGVEGRPVSRRLSMNENIEFRVRVVPPPRLPEQKLTDKDRAYRRALGVPEQGQLPSVIGTQSSAGAARGDRGASQRGRGRNNQAYRRGAWSAKTDDPQVEAG